jgi:hypothetical protein
MEATSERQSDDKSDQTCEHPQEAWFVHRAEALDAEPVLDEVAYRRHEATDRRDGRRSDDRPAPADSSAISPAAAASTARATLNTNGLLRQYFPKGTDRAAATQDELDAVAAQLNGRPRQTLGWWSSFEKFDKVVRSPLETAADRVA